MSEHDQRLQAAEMLLLYLEREVEDLRVVVSGAQALVDEKDAELERLRKEIEQLRQERRRYILDAMSKDDEIIQLRKEIEHYHFARRVSTRVDETET